jgi:2'-5' RNA ligase
VDHVIAPLDIDHDRVVTQLSRELASAVGITPAGATRRPHITVASYSGLEPAEAQAALVPVVATAEPFMVRAHGYGVFAGDTDADLSLHVVVVRSQDLDRLHCAVHRTLAGAGGCLAGTTHPSVWTPHITLLDRCLSPRLLGDAVEVLTSRPHRSWSIPLASLAIARRGTAVDPEIREIPLGGQATARKRGR